MSDSESLHQNTDTEVDVNSTQSNTSEDESSDLLSEHTEDETEDASLVSKEEDNCLRYFLGIGIAEKAVRMWFDTIIPPGQLENHLKRHEKKLRKICNDGQIPNLFPGNGTVTSTSFDISLLYKLIRNTTEIRQDWRGTPEATDIEPADDLERVRICRNSLCHGSRSISDTEFEKKWKELKEIIQRLAGGQLDKEIDSLQNKDLDHSEWTSVKRSLADLTKRLQTVEKCVGDHIPQNKREQLQRKVGQWKEEDKVFAEVPAYQSVRDKLRSLPFVTVTGSGGRGKTFLIHHIALELAKEGYEIIPVSAFDEITLYGKLNFKQLFVVDNVLGMNVLDMNLYNNLSRQSEDVLNLLQEESKLLMSCSSIVFKESKSLNSFVTKINHVVDLDDVENELNVENKKHMLENHCKINHVKKKYYEDLNLPRNLLMFPLLCKLFSSAEEYQAEGENFFLHPNQCIVSELDKIRELNKLHYAGLVYCVIKDNCVSLKSLDRKCLKEIYDCCGLNRSTSYSKLVHAMQVLEGTYLMQDTESRYSFIHDRLFEIVAVHFGRRFQDFFIEHCTSSSIYNLLTFIEEGKTCKENLIPVAVDNFPVLVDRIICDIKRFNLYEVFSRIGQFSQNEAFVLVFCKTLKNSNYDDFQHLFFEVNTSEHLNKKTKELFDEFDQKLEHFENILEAQEHLALNVMFAFLNKSHTRVVNWIIAYKHVGLLSGLIEIVREKRQPVEEKVCLTDKSDQDIMGIILGNDLESHNLCLNLACSSRSLDMVKLILSCVKHECINYIDEDYCPLVIASALGFTDVVKFLLKEGANVNLCNEGDDSALHYSCLFDQYDVVETLIEKRADVNLCRPDKDPPLSAAVMSGDPRIVKYLITKGAVKSVNFVDKDGQSLLHVACYFGNLDIVRTLVDNGADVNFCDRNGESPLCYASKYGYLENVKFLLQNGADIEIGASCLSSACEGGHLDVVKFLIDKMDVNKVNVICDPPLHCACSKGHLSIVKYLVEHGAEVNLLSFSNDSPLCCAVKEGQLPAVEYLLEHGADQDKAIEIAIFGGKVEIFELMLKHVH